MPLESEVVTSAQRIVSGSVLLAFGLAFLPLATWLVRRITGPVDAPLPPPWAPSDFGVVIASVILSVLGFALLVSGVGEPSIFVQLSVSIATLGVGVTTAAVLASRGGAGAFGAFTLRGRGLARAACAGVVAYVLLLPVFLGAGLVWPALLEFAGFAAEEQAVVRVMRAIAPADRPWALLLGVALGPLAEELFFRGFLQRALGRWFSPTTAIVAAAATFALLHGAFAFLPIFLLAVLLGAIAHATRNVLAAFVVHALFNAQNFALLWLFPEFGRALEGTPPGLWSLLRGG